MPRFIRIFFVALILSPTLAWSIDLQPNDVVAPPADKNYFSISYVNSESGNFYDKGSVATTGRYASPSIDANGAFARVARSYTLGDLPAISYLRLGYGSIQPSGTLGDHPSGTGVGDLVLATAIWPYANRETRTYFAVAGYLTLPTGRYSNEQPFNYGDNRYKFDLQLAFQKPIVGNLNGMIAVDTRWFGTNNQCGAACQSFTNTTLSQKPLTTIQLGPVYKVNDIFTVGASYFYVTGGGTAIDGRDTDNVVNTQRFLLSAQAYTSVGRFTLQYGRDMEVANGFFQNRLLAVRYLAEF